MMGIWPRKTNQICFLDDISLANAPHSFGEDMWQKKHTEGKAYFSSQLEGRVHHGERGTVAGAWKQLFTVPPESGSRGR